MPPPLIVQTLQTAKIHTAVKPVKTLIQIHQIPTLVLPVNLDADLLEQYVVIVLNNVRNAANLSMGTAHNAKMIIS